MNMDGGLTYIMLFFYLVMVNAIGLPHWAGTALEFASLCPDSVCNSSRKADNIHSCCQRCSCLPDCFKGASCCPGVQRNKFNETEYPCIELAKLSRNESVIEDNISYRIVDQCPDEETTKAYPRCTYPSELQDYVPVSDVQYEKVFRNCHCANCHGVVDYIQWRLSVSCHSLAFYTFETFAERNKYILERCPFSPIPPDDKRVDLSRCFIASNVRSTCNITGLWNYYDQHLEKACNTEWPSLNTAYAQFQTPFLTDYFSNVYCFLCNSPKNTDMCRKPSTYTEPTRIKLIKFSATIDFLPQQSTTETAKCKSMDIWDPFRAVCRRVFCPVGTTPIDGRCQNNWDSSEGFSVSVIFEILAPRAEVYIPFREPLLKALIETLGPDFSCGTCVATLTQYMNETNMKLEVPFYTTMSCSRQTLIEILRDLALKEKIVVTFNTREKSVPVIMKVILKKKQDFFIRVYKVVNPSNAQRICRKPTQFNNTYMNNCPRVKLTTSEFDQLCVKESRLRSLFRNASLKDATENTISMCVEDYFILRDCTIQERNRCQHVDKNMHLYTVILVFILQRIYIKF